MHCREAPKITIETAVYISDLNASNPGASDLKAEGDDHMRLIKACVKATFPNITGPVTATQGALNTAPLPLAGGTATGTITAPSFVGPLTGNASTATALATPRAINGVNFDGTAPITVADATKLPLTGGVMSGALAIYTAGSAITATFPLDVVGTVNARDNRNLGSTLGAKLYGGDASNNPWVGSNYAANFELRVNGTTAATVDTSGNLTPAATNAQTLGGASLRWSTVNSVLGNFSGVVTMADNSTMASGEVGYKGLPAASVTTGAFAAADRGKCVNATGGVTVPNATMSAGDVVTIDNQSGGAITITATITTLKLAGTTSTGNRTLAADGICTIKFRSGTVAVISGAGLT